MSESFDKNFWDDHWVTPEAGHRSAPPANPHLAAEVRDLPIGTALDAGCGVGAEAIWLASNGWQVTGADISARALGQARSHAAEAGVDVDWIEADLSAWQPGQQFDLVTTFYAHPAIPQREFYQLLTGLVRPGGTLLIVGHLEAGDEGDHTSVHARVRADEVAATLVADGWMIATADERERKLSDSHGHPTRLHDVIVRATAPTVG